MALVARVGIRSFERDDDRRVDSGFNCATSDWPPPDRRRADWSATTLVGPRSTDASPFSAATSPRCSAEDESTVAAEASIDFGAGDFDPDILAVRLVLALKAEVGVRDWAMDRRASDFCVEVSISFVAGRLSVRRRLAESEAVMAGLGVPPRSRSRFLETPEPAIPLSPFETESVFAFS